MPYYLDNQFLLDNPWITVVGCGGTGGFVAEGLCRLFQGRDATIVLVDHDRVEPHNLLRQNFYPGDVGEFKSKALADRGLALLVRRDRTSLGVAKKRWSMAPQDAQAPLAWRNVSGRRSRQLLRNIEHTASVHAFIAALTGQARLLGWEVSQLDPPARASRYFRHQDRMRSVNPDAFGVLRKGGTAWPFFLEWERRAVRPSTMSARLAPYLRYFSSHRPTDDHSVRPSVLVVFDDDIAQTHFLRVAREEMQVKRVTVPLWVSHREAIEQMGPLGRVWRTPGQWDSPQALPPR